MSKPFLVTEDFTKQFNEIVSKFKRDAVLVGIPAVDVARDDDEPGPINNATILAINEFGSPANNIPPRPVMSMGIHDAQEPIAEQMKKAVQMSFKGGLGGLEKYYNRAGIIASTSVKKVINGQGGEIDGPIESPAASTLASRRSRGFKGDKALIVTGQLRNAITYVVNVGGF